MGECNGRSLGMRPTIIYSWYFRPLLIPYFSVIWHFYLTTQSSWIKLDVTCQTLPSLPHPPPSPPLSSAPEICHSFYSIISETTSTPYFLCEAKEDCATGIICTLDILDTFYTTSVTISYMKKLKMQWYRLVLLTACRGWLAQVRQKMQPFLFLNLREERLSSTRLCQLDQDALIGFWVRISWSSVAHIPMFYHTHALRPKHDVAFPCCRRHRVWYFFSTQN